MKYPSQKKALKVLLILAAAAGGLTGIAGAGSLEPPGFPAPTMKTLDQVQPRTPVQLLMGTATGLYSIEEPGSYYLAGDILGSSGMNGIEIHAPEVVLDLNGFSVVGVPGSLSGIVVEHDLPNVAVRNGIVRGWEEMGVWNASPSGEVSAVQASENGDSGIRLRGGLISRCTAMSNFNRGIYLEEMGGLIIDCHSSGNWETGIIVEWRGQVQNCAVADNIIGIDAAWEDVQVLNSFIGSNGVGVRVYSGSLISGNQFTDNGWGVQVRDDGQANRIEGNSFLRGNTGVRIDPLALGNFVAKNAAHHLDTAAYDIPGGNSFGPIINVAGAGDISAIPGSDHPWANFIY